ncbi:histone deacetylase 4 isoform X3 [Frankliniella occidentalis]|uniref:Histone deacetylase n=1 Tax=Frankliniella occidentalis TaxID=133901 RepID=A0A9C6UA62_FRAOC|nr:histone deacetylase 4 isoform X3 [Frankliniella occidentalis]
MHHHEQIVGAVPERAEVVRSYRSVGISQVFSHLPQKDMTRESPVDSPLVARRNDLHNMNESFHLDPGLHAEDIQQQILKLKKHQQLQQQILLQHYQQQQQCLAEQHEQQLRHHLKQWEQQKQLEEQRERREKERLEALRKKDKHEQSAVASSGVKEKLQVFLLNKKQREAMANGSSPGHQISPSTSATSLAQQSQQSPSIGGQPFRNWSVLQPPAPGDTGNLNAGAGPNAVHPYRLNPLVAKYEEDFPLRKTASEPNLLKVRLKQRVIDRRANPLAGRKDRLQRVMKRRSHLAMDISSSNPDSGPNSPPGSCNRQASPSAGGRNTPIQEEGENLTYGQLSNSSEQGSISDLSLYSSPSMPNISLGRPPAPSSSREGGKLAPVSEAEVRAAFTARLGMPLTGQMMPGTLPFYPTLPVLEAEYSNPTSPGYIHKQMQSLEQAHGPVTVGAGAPVIPAPYHPPITDSQVAHARLNKQGHRPLGRTQSAPLPLGHPMLTGSGLTVVPHHGNYEDYLLQEKQQTLQHNLLKQQIRQTVLTRANSRGLSTSSSGGQLDETDENAEVIDLTERRSEDHELTKQQREFLQQQRDLRMRHTLQISEGSAFTPRSHVARPLSRALSSPLVALGTTDGAGSIPLGVSSAGTAPKVSSGVHRLTTGLAYDNTMLKHACTCGDNSSHPEHSGRLHSVWARLLETGLVQRCDRVRARKASLEELKVCHSEAHALLFGTNPLNRQKLDMNKLAQLPIKCFVRLPCGGVGVDSDTTWNELHTAPAARMAAGCVIDLAYKTATGDIKNGFAVVRPPGHHAEPSQAMGFCFFNSVAVAAKLVQQNLNVPRILIVDWDVHHGNGTQQMFYDDPRILYLSIHRHDDGNFFPGTGGPTECGEGKGLGFNINVAWSGGVNPPMGDAEYLAAFRTIVMPIAKEYAPDLILVSAGFDAAIGHAPPLGGYKVSPACFGYMTHQLLPLADGKVVLALEGGYDLPAICDSAQECVRALLGDDTMPVREDELRREPCQNAIDTLQKTIAIQQQHWPCLKRLAHTVSCSALEASQKERDETETVTAMASLSMQHQANNMQSPEHSREPSEEPMEQDEVK